MREVQEKIFDDLLFRQNDEKVEASDTVGFAIDGQEFRIDLTADNAEAFREMVRPFAEAATPVTKRSSSKKSASTSAAPSASTPKKSTPKKGASSSKDVDELNQQIREWARGQGFDVSDRGRLPKHIRDAWATAQHNGGGDNGGGAPAADVTFDRLTDEQPPAEPTFDAIEESTGESQDVDERV